VLYIIPIIIVIVIDFLLFVSFHLLRSWEQLECVARWRGRFERWLRTIITRLRGRQRCAQRVRRRDPSMTIFVRLQFWFFKDSGAY
jgi:hypothetical protein